MLSVVIPVFNERATIRELLDQVQAVPVPKEIVVVDDFSTDGTRTFLRDMDADGVKVVLHPHNRGKGAALRTGFGHVTGDVVIIQDADLEYDPADYLAVIRPILDGEADVVYGSRFLGDHRFASFSHYAGNRFLTWLTNLLYGSQLTDMETCYKAFRTEVLLSIPLQAERFDFEPEITAKLLTRGYHIPEVPISYEGRAFGDGKKISWRDGFAVVRMLIYHRVIAHSAHVRVENLKP